MRKPPALLIAGVTLLVAGLIWHASLRRPAGPADGVDARGEIAQRMAPGPTIRVGAFNIHGCKGTDRRRDLDRVAEYLVGMDLVALSEVHWDRLTHSHDQALRLGQKLGLASVFAPSVLQWYRYEFGNGLLTAMPVNFWQRIPLARRYDRSYRNALLVGLKHQDRTILALITHVTRRDDRERRAQLRAVIALFLALEEPAMLLGDLNSPPDDPQIRQLLARPGVVDAVGINPEASPRYRVDWVIARGLRAVDAGKSDNGASDHPLYWAELELPGMVEGDFDGKGERLAR